MNESIKPIINESIIGKNSVQNIKNDDSNIISLYSNSVQVQGGLYDLQLIFSFQYPAYSEVGSEIGNVINKELARIAMSPQHAKVLTNILNQNIYKYEQNFGEIKLPDELANIGK